MKEGRSSDAAAAAAEAAADVDAEAVAPGEEASEIRLVDASLAEEDVEGHLRPQRLSSFIGQERLCENLGVFLSAARQRAQALDHVLVHGPPGLGKTTLAHIVAYELGVQIRVTSGPALVRAGDLAAVLTSLRPREVLFIDEIHRLLARVEELLYTAMEDFQIDVMIGEGVGARAVRLDVAPFTLIGATTRAGLLSTPLRERFGVHLSLNFYDEQALSTIVARAARVMSLNFPEEACQEIARRARGTPRIALRLLRRVADFALMAGLSSPDSHFVDDSLRRLEVDGYGLDALDRRYLRTLGEKLAGGPAGVETLAAALAESRDVLEEVVEPFLLQQGMILRSARGRVLTAHGFSALGLVIPAPAPSMAPLMFGAGEA